MNERFARLLFQRRNAIFPLVFAVLLAIRPPLAFTDPLARVMLIIGLASVVLGQSLRVLTIGLKYIKRGGKKGKFYADDLVTDGIFGHCRNPLYVGNILIGLGFLCVAGDPWCVGIGAVLVLWAYSLIVGGEERYLAAHFGEAYTAYCARVPRWGIKLRGIAGTLGSSRFDWVRVVNKEYGTLYTSVLFPTGLIAWKLYRTGGMETLRPWLIVLGAVAGVATLGYIAARVLKKTHRLDPPPAIPRTPEEELEAARKQIDAIDARLLKVLNRRADVVLSIFEIKREQRVARFDAGRTRAIIERLKSLNTGPLSDEQVERLFECVLEQNLRLGDSAPRTDGVQVEVVVKSRSAAQTEVAHVE